MIKIKLFAPVYSKIIKTLLTILLLFPLTSFSQSIIYVKHDAVGVNNGSSWTDAYTTLYSALANATAEDTIWVAQGSYYPEDISGRWSTLQMIKEVSVYGGFNGTETDLSQRDHEINTTILSGDIGVADDATDNAYHVVTAIDTARIDGFTIQEGYADGGGYTTNSGGGIFIYSPGGLEDFVVANCILKDNKAVAYGGAIHNYNAQEVLITNCTFTTNGFIVSQNLAGGALATYQSQIEITNCRFTNNEANYLDGGAIYNDHSTVTTINTSFSGNFTYNNGKGGAIANYLSNTSVSNSIFSENQTTQFGGAIYNIGSTPSQITNCTFYQNIGGSNGGL